MLLLSSGNSGLKEPSSNMVLSQVHAWAEKMEREQERENNNNTVKRDLLRTPPPRCKDFLYVLDSKFNSIYSEHYCAVHLSLHYYQTVCCNQIKLNNS